MFHLINNIELELTFDMVGVDDHLPSVAFDIGVYWNMPFQNAKIEIKECWFECAALNAFEDSIKNLINNESGKVVLANLSDYPILSFSKSGQEMNTEIFSKDTSGRGTLSLKVKGYSSELSGVLQKLREFEKWW